MATHDNRACVENLAWTLFDPPLPPPASLISPLLQIYPIAQLTLNYAPVAVGIVMVGSMVAWFFPFIGAYSWFKVSGPRAALLITLSALKGRDSVPYE